MTAVSIIVPVYNVDRYLCACLDSLIAQTLSDIEIILVDDGSTDNSGKICDQYAAENESKVKVLHKENGGQSSARNLGVSIARGEYILFVDSDDYIRKDSCEVLYHAAVEHQADIVHGDTINDESNLESASFRKMRSENKVVAAIDFLQDSLESETYDIVPWLNLIKRSLISEYHLTFFEGCFYEDQLYNLQMLTLNPNARVLKIRFPFYYYRMDRPDSTTNYISLRKVQDSVKIIHEMYEYCVQNDSGNCALYQTVMMISLFQYSRIWLLASNSTRVHKSVAVDRKIVDYAMGQDAYYSYLKARVKRFFRNRYYLAAKSDVKRLLRKLKG